MGKNKQPFKKANHAADKDLDSTSATAHEQPNQVVPEVSEDSLGADLPLDSGNAGDEASVERVPESSSGDQPGGNAAVVSPEAQPNDVSPTPAFAKTPRGMSSPIFMIDEAPYQKHSPYTNIIEETMTTPENETDFAALPDFTPAAKEEQTITSTDVGSLNALLGETPAPDALDDVQALASKTPAELQAQGIERVGKQSFKFSSGSVVDPTAAQVGKAAPEAFQAAIQTQRTDTPVDTRTPWQYKIDAILNEGTNKRERYVATQMEAYLSDMAPNKEVSTETGILRQKQLWRTLKNVVSVEDGFDDAVLLMIEYFREHKNGALGAIYLHRFHPELDLSADESRGLAQLANIFTTAAGVKNLKDVLKHCALRSVDLKGVDEIVRERLYNFFDNK